MKKEYTIETRIEAPLNSEIRVYLDEYVVFYNKVYREMWHEMTSKDHKKHFSSKSKYITYICDKYHLLKRTVNSIYFDVDGRMKSYKELKKTERKELIIKIAEQEDKVCSLKNNINTLKPKVASNKATNDELKKYRRYKFRLYNAQNRLNRMRQCLSNLEYAIEHDIYSLGFGGKRMFRKQYHLKVNKYKTFTKWKNDYHKARDTNIYYVGSSDETCGNQLLQMSYDDASDTFSIKLRKEYNYCEDENKYITLHGITFKHLHDELVNVVKSYGNKPISPLTYRFKRRGTRWYLQVIFKIETVEYLTRISNGTIGLDYNDGFIEMAETDEKGNLCHLEHYPLRYHGTGNRAKSEIEETISMIVNYSLEKGKDIIIEDLDFKKKKSKVRKNKKYNKMIHMFDYSRYKKTMENTCHRRKVGLVKVNPYNTSKIGRMKYSNQKKLTVHQSAGYVIARRGQGYTDRI